MLGLTTKDPNPVNEAFAELNLALNQLFPEESKDDKTREYLLGYTNAILDAKNLVKERIK